MSDIRTDDLKTGYFDTWAEIKRKRGDAVKTVEVYVDSRATTRQAIIVALRRAGFTFQTRSDWKAVQAKAKLEADWDYTAIAIHHAGNSYSCGADGATQLRKAQHDEMATIADDISYHYAVDCQGVVYEARDVRFKGAHVEGSNGKKIGIVLLEDLSKRGEAWDQEYKDKSWFKILRALPELAKDNVDVVRDEPSEVQLKALHELVKVLKQFFLIDTIGGHREFQRKGTGHGRACPGFMGMLIVEQLRKDFGTAAP